jgi:hypothetical protein
MNPDFYIEKFWLDFKQSMNNFYSEKTSLIRPINYWSNELNELQKKRHFNLIENNIRNYMSLYAIDLMRTCSLYHTGILITNIKRWNKITTNYTFDIHSDTKYINIVFLLLDLFNTLTNKCTLDNDKLYMLFNMVELFIIHEDLTVFIDYAIENNKPSIIDNINLFEFQNNHNKSIKYIEQKYNIELNNKISGGKLLNKISLIKNEN